MRPATRLYRFLIALYPRHRRREDGENMAEMFTDIYEREPESRGIVGRSRLATATFRDIVGGAVTERLPFLDILGQDLRYGFRRLRDNPTLTMGAVFTLALGIGAVTSIYSFVDALVLHPLPYPDVDRIVAMGETTPRYGLNGEGWMHQAEFRQLEELDSLDTVAALTPFFVTMTGAGDPEEVIGYTATADFFAVLQTEPMLGRAFTDDVADTDTVVLGYAFWQRRFGGDPGVIGHSLRFGEREMVVIGVMPRGAEFPMGTDLWVPLSPTPWQSASYDEGHFRPIGRLADGASLARLRAELAAVAAMAAEAAPDVHVDTRIEAEPILANITINTRTALGFLMGAAAFLLLLVCGNVANMQLAQASARREEMAMRMALGAQRGRLVRQLLTESLALAALAGVAGTLLARWGGSGLRAALAHQRWRFYFSGVDDIGINTSVLAFAAFVSLGAVIVFGLAPALRCSRVDLAQALKQSGAGDASGGGRMRRALVVLEVALSVVLLAAAGIMVQSIGGLGRFDPGVDTDVLTVALRLPRSVFEEPARLQRFFDDAVDEASAVPGIVAAAVANRIPASRSGSGTPLETDGGAPIPGDAARAGFQLIGGAYFDTLGIPILAGRRFDGRDVAGSPRSVIVSATLAARLWPGDAAVGRRLRAGPDQPWLAVVGVAGDVARAWNDNRPAASAYRPYAQSPDRHTPTLLLRIEGDQEVAMHALRERLWSLDDAVVVFAPESIDAAIDTLAHPVRFMSELVGWMALAALLVCMSGVYALVAHAAGLRTREIGVRMALGAGRRQVVRMLVLHGARTGIAGIVIGLFVAMGLARLLAAFIERMLTADAWVFVAPVVAMPLLVILSSWLPARRAARVDPAVTLRAD